MTSVLSFSDHLSEEKRGYQAICRLGSPEAQERIAREAKERACALESVDLPDGEVFAKIPWGEGRRHFLWSVLLTKGNLENGLYGAKRTTTALLEDHGKDESLPVDACTAIQMVDGDLLRDAVIYAGPDPWDAFAVTFAGHPAMLQRKEEQRYDKLTCLRAIESFRLSPFAPDDTMGARRLMRYLEERRATLRSRTASDLHDGVMFGEPMRD